MIHWFKSDLVGYTREILFSKQSRERGFFNAPAVKAILSEHAQGRVDRARHLRLMIVRRLHKAESVFVRIS